jgi:hypothetical protein
VYDIETLDDRLLIMPILITTSEIFKDKGLSVPSRDLSFVQTVHTGTAAHLITYAIDNRGALIWIERSGREAVHSLPPST